MKRQTGLSLLEVLCVVAIMAILLAIANPAFSSLRQRQALKSAAEALSQLFQFAQRRALQSGVGYGVSINAELGCAVVVAEPGCDCAASDCRERADYQLGSSWLAGGVAISELRFTGDGSARFSPLRGAATAGHVLLRSADGNGLKVVVSRLGRVRLCRPVGGEGGYPPCE
ncbi:MAG: GspH/FimT family pseudopilin [Gammaproteobacteria bacterium]|nr:GspH/FimT family pseudopilin [Gammaproteobacteria bacterium]